MKSLLKYSLIVLMVCLLWVSCDTASTVDPVYKDTFIKYYGQDGDQEGKDLVINSDGTIIILGTSTAPGGSKRMYLAKTDAEGTIIWEKKLGEINRDEVAQDIEPILAGPDFGKFVVLSNIKKNVADSLAIRLTIISPAGDSLKSILLNQLESQEAKSVTPLSDGAYFITGKTTNTIAANNSDFPNDVEDILVIKLQSDFSGIQLDQIGASSIGSGIKIFEGSNIFYFAGYSNERNIFQNPDNEFESNFTLRSITPGGASGTQTGYAGSDQDDEILVSIARSLTGSKYLAVGTQINGASRRIYLSILASNFSVDVTDVIGGEAEGVAASPTASGQFLVVCNSIDVGGNKNIWVSKFDVFLDVTLGPFQFGGTNNDDTASAVAELPNGDIVVLGTMELTNQKKIALIKLKSNGGF